MRFEITARGVYGRDGKPIPVGQTVEVKDGASTAWLANKARAAGGQQVAVTNPAVGGVQQATSGEGYAVANKGRGWFVVTKGGAEVTKSLRKEDVDGFDELSDEDKAAYVEAHKAEA